MGTKLGCLFPWIWKICKRGLEEGMGDVRYMSRLYGLSLFSFFFPCSFFLCFSFPVSLLECIPVQSGFPVVSPLSN